MGFPETGRVLCARGEVKTLKYTQIGKQRAEAKRFTYWMGKLTSSVDWASSGGKQKQKQW